MRSPAGRTVTALALVVLLLFGTALRAGGPERNPHLPAARALAEEALRRMKEGSHYPEAERRARESARIVNERKTEMTEEARKALGVTSSGEKKRTAARKNPPRKKFYLVISSSVPEETLRTYMAQIEDLAGNGVEIVPVLRGFVDGMKKIHPTLEFYLRIALRDPAAGLSPENLRPVPIHVDPLATRGVSAVPALRTADGSCTVYGDAPLRFLLRKIREGACGRKFGAVFEFAEKNALSEIREVAEKTFQDEKTLGVFFARRVKELLKLPGEEFLPPARYTVTEVIEPEFKLPFEIRDPKTGRILYPKGFKFNPLKYMPEMPFEILLINGTRPSEVAFARRMISEKPGLAVRALGGDAGKLSKILKRPVLSGLAIARAGWCSATPCLVRRKGQALEITEFGPEDLKPEVTK